MKKTTILLLVAIPLFASTPQASVRYTFPFVNMNGYTTDLVTINPSGETVHVNRPCPDNQSSCPPITDAFPSYSSVRTHNWPGSGTDYAGLVTDPRLRVYPVIRTPLGTIAHLPGLQLYTSTVRFFDLPPTGEFEAHLWIAVPKGQEGTFVSVHDESTQMVRSFLMERGAIVVPVGGPSARIYLGAAPGWPALPAPSGVYTFAATVHDATGAITAHEGHQ
jgi:hypothetical protein